jgi:nitrous oxide reductase accessory protein NosL
MFKIISALVMLVLFSACTQTSQPSPKKQVVKQEVKQEKKQAKKVMKHHKMKKMGKMFQTVDAKDATLVQKGKNHNSCAICGMNLTKFYKTSHIASHEGKEVQYCSIHCLEHHLKDGAQVKNPEVVDVSSLKFIPVLEAYYVVGSDVRGTMSRVSKYAFKNLEDAKKFQKKHGGKIMDFQGALAAAKKDFK